MLAVFFMQSPFWFEQLLSRSFVPNVRDTQRRKEEQRRKGKPPCFVVSLCETTRRIKATPKTVNCKLELFLHHIMRDRNLFKLVATALVAHFFIEADGILTGMHSDDFVAPVAGEVFGESH